MISLTEARRIIAETVLPRPAHRMALDEAGGLVLAEAVLADEYYPSGDRALMDGYVVRADAEPGTFRLVGEIPAGVLPEQELGRGDCYRIFTGALLPPGGGRVVMQEEAVCRDALVSIATFNPRLWVREKGSEAQPGQVLLPAGTVLGAAEMAVLAQIGMTRPLVIPAPTVHQIATGSELVDPGEVPEPGQIRDTNSGLLRALFSGAGVQTFSTQRVPDDPKKLVDAADCAADLVILSGGASVGDYDFGARALRELGYTIHFDKVNLRPGKPLTFATRGSQAAFVVPGNPISHFVCYHVALQRAVETAAGRPCAWPLIWLDLAEGSALAPDPRETWWPARTQVRDGQAVVTPLPWSTSGNTFALAGTNALVLVNQGSPAVGRALTLLLAPPAS